MLSFRYHIVSLIAVFLALAIGIAVGSTFIDRAIVDSLQDRVDTVSDNLDARRAENARLGDRIDGLEDYVEASAPWMVAGRLDDEPVTVVAERGVDGDQVEATAALARQAGAQVPGLVWLEPAFAFADEDAGEDAGEAAAELGEVLEVSGEDPAALQQAALDGLADPERSSVVLDALVDGGFASVAPVGDQPVEAADVDLAGSAVVWVTGPESELDPGALAARGAAALVASEVPVLVGEAYVDTDDGPRRGELLAPILDDEVLVDAVSTDDAIDLVRGRTAVVLQVAELLGGEVTHVGYGEGVSGTLPEAPAPAAAPS